MALGACSAASPPGTAAAPYAGASNARSQAWVPAERTVTLDLDEVVAGGGFYERLPSTKNGSSVTLSVSSVKYKGATMTVRYGTLVPKGVPLVPGSKKALLWATITVDKAVVANGEWNVVLENPSCLPNRADGAYYPAHGTWSTSSQFACPNECERAGFMPALSVAAILELGASS